MKASSSPNEAEFFLTKRVRKGGSSPGRTGVAAVLAIAAATCVQAAPITMVQSNNTSGQSWLTTGSWSNNAAPSVGNTYFVTGTAFTVRTPQPTSPAYTFGGDSLSINNARLLFATLGGSNVTINNLTLTNNGMLANGVAGSTQTLSGTMAVNGNAFVRMHNVAAEAARNITIASQITGTGNIGVIQKGTLTLTGAGNTFNGTWTVGGTGVTVPDGTYSNSSTVISTFVASSAGSLGSDSNVTLNIWSRFDVNYDWNTDGALTLASNGGSATAIIMTLDQNITVGALTVAGFSFGTGTYDYNALSTAGYADYFTNSGGSITVIPEPTALALLALGSMSVVFWSRRLRNRVS